jgi:hypothetical protein
MDCPEARRRLEEALDARQAPDAALAEHLAGCAACSRQLAQLREIESAARETLEPLLDETRASRAVEGALAKLSAARPRARALGLGLAAVVSAFAAGVLCCRLAWPRTIERTLPEPVVIERVVEKPVRVEVPVFRERTVVRTVRVPAGARPPARRQEQPVHVEMVIAPPTTVQPVVAPTFSVQMEPAHVAGEPPDAPPATPTDGGETRPTLP